jgi:hypothetical protein
MHYPVSGLLRNRQVNCPREFVQGVCERLKTAQARAVRFAENVLEDSDLADDLESLTPEEYADRKGIIITNPMERRISTVANGNGRTKQDLLDEIDQLQQENQDLQDQLDAIADIVVPPDEGDEDDYDDDSDDDGQD